jgi:hypothetical protein
MILIQNVSTGIPFGEQEYEVRINERVITRFTHRREDGLVKCLLAAAKAVEQARWEEAVRILQILQAADRSTPANGGTEHKESR